MSRKPNRRRYRRSYSRRTWLRPAGVALALVLSAGAGYFYAPQRQPASGASQVNAVAIASASKIGRASVIDGDTIEIGGERIRFSGIDAPESSQLCRDADGAAYHCGADSAMFLDNLLASSRPTRCNVVDRDRYGRSVAKCFLANGVSVADRMVSEGHAVDWPRYSHGAHLVQQTAAKKARKGVWKGTFEMPWDYRANVRNGTEKKRVPLVSNAGQNSCDIKGNINRRGARIYHVPGQKYYQKTVISPSKGERWFCSEMEARAAGWRAARQ